MTLIEGVGDEVVQFVGVVLVVVVGALAWWSTNARPDRYRTLLVMRSRTHHPVTVSIRTRTNLMMSNTQPNTAVQASTSDSIAGSSGATGAGAGESRVIPLQEMDSIVDADMAMLDNHRLHFYRRIDSLDRQPSPSEAASEESEVSEVSEVSEESEASEERESTSTDQMREMDSIVHAMEADHPFNRTRATNSPATVEVTAPSDSSNAANSEGASSPPEEMATSGDIPQSAGADEADRIRIKLKYLNDTYKEVDGSLDELLKDFKWRHFSRELSRLRRVRLIFRGRALEDGASLRACGLFHGAVVHCLVHPPAQPMRNEESSPEATHELVAEAPDRTWDLENILMTLVSVALTIVWFFRCEYSNMFTASASVALFGLTVFYSVAIFGLYITDTFQFDRRPQPVPNN